MSKPRPMFGRAPLRMVCSVTKKPFGSHGGHITLLQLQCGHVRESIGSYVRKVGEHIGCEEFR